MFQNTQVKLLRTLYEKYFFDENFPIIDFGLKKVCSDEKFAFMVSDFEVGEANLNLNCTLQLLEGAWSRHIGLAISKSNPFREALNRLLVSQLLRSKK